MCLRAQFEKLRIEDAQTRREEDKKLVDDFILELDGGFDMIRAMCLKRLPHDII